eukprot:6064582-Amphidinium_carterae.1
MASTTHRHDEEEGATSSFMKLVPNRAAAQQMLHPNSDTRITLQWPLNNCMHHMCKSPSLRKTTKDSRKI